MTWTPASAGVQLEWTLSFWAKKTTQDARVYVWGAGDDPSAEELSYIQLGQNSDSNRFTFLWRDGSTTSRSIQTTAAFPTGVWTHVVMAFDAANNTAADRIKLYIDGSPVTSFIDDDRSTLSSSSSPPMNAAVRHAIGVFAYNLAKPATSSAIALADMHFIDGQVLGATDFGETVSGTWYPKAYSGTYGSNGWRLDFTDSANLGTDVSGNSNNWTEVSLTTSSQQTDVPSSAPASGTSLANTGILSLSELLQASYGTAAAWDGTGVELLLVAGGGGGGGVVTGSANIGGGGGGAGAYYPLSNQTFALNTSYTFTVGAGGAGNTGAGQGSSGGATTLVGGSFNLSSPGGGGGGAFGSAASNGASGGSGGGAGWNSTGGSSTAGAGQFGNAGGSTSGLSKAGGGGGAGSAGAISGSNYDGADGGSGKTWAIDGVALAGGGGAGGWQGQGTGYIGQGQDGGANGSGGTATANTGGGGGGGRRAATEAGTDGATGVIKVWVPQAGYSGYTAGTPANVTASAVTYSGTAGTLLTVTGTTTITFS